MRWTEGVDRKLLDLKHGRTPTPGEAPGNLVRLTGGRSFQQVAAQLNAIYGTSEYTKDAVQKRYKALQGRPVPSLYEYPAPRPTPYLDQHFDEAGNLLEPAPAKVDLARYLCDLEGSGRYYKTLVLSDTQGVFCDWDLLTQATDEQYDADLIVVPGDVADWEAASRYTHEQDYPLLLESDWLVRFYTALSDRYPGIPVIITGSNHRRRIEKAVRQLPQGMLFLAEHNPEKYLAQPFPNIHALEPWWTQIGDIIYAHKEGKTTIPGNNVLDAITTFTTWYRSRQFVMNEFRYVVTGHSHKVAEVYAHGTKGVEPGCLARLPMLYTTAAHLVTTQDNGYAYSIQRGGKVQNPNDVRAVKLESSERSV